MICSIIEICDKAFEEPISQRDIYNKLIDKFVSSAYFLYAHNQEVLGYISFYANDFINRTAFISLIAVKPEFQNKHIGSRLLEECFKIAKSKGMETIQLEVLKTNSLAIRFYKRHSFSFLYEKGEESYIYQKNLGAGRRIMDSRKLDEKNIPEIIRGGVFPNSKKVLGIYCAGGFGRSTMELAKEVNKSEGKWDGFCFITDVELKEEVQADVYFFEEFIKKYSTDEAEVIIAIGEPLYRENLFKKIKAAGYSLPNLIHPTATIHREKLSGAGNIIQDYAHISPSSTYIGDNNVFMTFSRVAHDSHVGNHCVFSAGAMSSGNDTIEDRCYIGTGAKLREKICIGHDAIVGMGAVVTKSVDAYSVVVGNPAREIRKNSGRVF